MMQSVGSKKYHIPLCIRITAMLMSILFTWTTISLPILSAQEGSVVYRVQIPETMGKVSERYKAPQENSPLVKGARGLFSSRTSPAFSGTPFDKGDFNYFSQSAAQDVPNLCPSVEQHSRTVVLIQDAHTSFDAQKNIAGILSNLIAQITEKIEDRRQKVDVDIQKDDQNLTSHSSLLTSRARMPFIIGVEGAIGDIDLADYRTFPIKEARDAIAQEYVKQGIFTGSELAGITNDAVQLYGVEDKAIFEENYRAFLALTQKQEMVQRMLERRRAELMQKKEKIYNDDLRKFDSKYELYKTGTRSIEDFLPLLHEHAQVCTVDLTKYCMLMMLIERSAAASSEKEKPLSLDVVTLQREINGCAEEIITHYAVTEREKEVALESKTLSMLEKVLTLRAERDEVACFQKWIENYDVSSVSEKRGTLDYQVCLEVLPLVTQFYTCAFKRDEIMVNNLLHKMDAEKKNIGVLVSGGFHSAGMSRLLREQGVNYLTITPQVSGDLTSIPYLARLTGKLFAISPELTSYFTALHSALSENKVKLPVGFTEEACAEVFRMIVFENADSDAIKKQLGLQTVSNEAIARLMNDIRVLFDQFVAELHQAENLHGDRSLMVSELKERLAAGRYQNVYGALVNVFQTWYKEQSGSAEEREHENDVSADSSVLTAADIERVTTRARAVLDFLIQNPKTRTRLPFNPDGPLTLTLVGMGTIKAVFKVNDGKNSYAMAVECIPQEYEWLLPDEEIAFFGDDERTVYQRNKGSLYMPTLLDIFYYEYDTEGNVVSLVDAANKSDATYGVAFLTFAEGTESKQKEEVLTGEEAQAQIPHILRAVMHVLTRTEQVQSFDKKRMLRYDYDIYCSNFILQRDDNGVLARAVWVDPISPYVPGTRGHRIQDFGALMDDIYNEYAKTHMRYNDFEELVSRIQDEVGSDFMEQQRDLAYYLNMMPGTEGEHFTVSEEKESEGSKEYTVITVKNRSGREQASVTYLFNPDTRTLKIKDQHQYTVYRSEKDDPMQAVYGLMTMIHAWLYMKYKPQYVDFQGLSIPGRNLTRRLVSLDLLRSREGAYANSFYGESARLEQLFNNEEELFHVVTHKDRRVENEDGFLITGEDVCIRTPAPRMGSLIAVLVQGKDENIYGMINTVGVSLEKVVQDVAQGVMSLENQGDDAALLILPLYAGTPRETEVNMLRSGLSAALPDVHAWYSFLAVPPLAGYPYTIYVRAGKQSVYVEGKEYSFSALHEKADSLELPRSNEKSDNFDASLAEYLNDFWAIGGQEFTVADKKHERDPGYRVLEIKYGRKKERVARITYAWRSEERELEIKNQNRYLRKETMMNDNGHGLITMLHVWLYNQYAPDIVYFNGLSKEGMSLARRLESLRLLDEKRERSHQHFSCQMEKVEELFKGDRTLLKKLVGMHFENVERKDNVVFSEQNCLIRTNAPERGGIMGVIIHSKHAEEGAYGILNTVKMPIHQITQQVAEGIREYKTMYGAVEVTVTAVFAGDPDAGDQTIFENNIRSKYGDSALPIRYVNEERSDKFYFEIRVVGEEKSLYVNSTKYPLAASISEQPFQEKESSKDGDKESIITVDRSMPDEEDVVQEVARFVQQQINAGGFSWMWDEDGEDIYNVLDRRSLVECITEKLDERFPGKRYAISFFGEVTRSKDGTHSISADLNNAHGDVWAEMKLHFEKLQEQGFESNGFVAKAEAVEINENNPEYYSKEAMKDGSPVSIANPEDAERYGRQLVERGRATVNEVFTIVDPRTKQKRELVLIIENDLGITEDMISTALKRALKVLKGDITKLPSALIIVSLDKSSHVFEDHISNGLIGINRLLYTIQEEHVRALFLTYGLFHEMCHEVTGLSGKQFESKQVKRDAQLFWKELQKKKISLWQVECTLRTYSKFFSYKKKFMRAVRNEIVSKKKKDLRLDNSFQEEISRAEAGILSFDEFAFIVEGCDGVQLAYAGKYFYLFGDEESKMVVVERNENGFCHVKWFSFISDKNHDKEDAGEPEEARAQGQVEEQGEKGVEEKVDIEEEPSAPAVEYEERVMISPFMPLGWLTEKKVTALSSDQEIENALIEYVQKAGVPVTPVALFNAIVDPSVIESLAKSKTGSVFSYEESIRTGYAEEPIIKKYLQVLKAIENKKIAQSSVNKYVRSYIGQNTISMEWIERVPYTPEFISYIGQNASYFYEVVLKEILDDWDEEWHFFVNEEGLSNPESNVSMFSIRTGIKRIYAELEELRAHGKALLDPSRVYTVQELRQCVDTAAHHIRSIADRYDQLYVLLVSLYEQRNSVEWQRHKSPGDAEFVRRLEVFLGFILKYRQEVDNIERVTRYIYGDRRAAIDTHVNNEINALVNKQEIMRKINGRMRLNSQLFIQRLFACTEPYRACWEEERSQIGEHVVEAIVRMFFSTNETSPVKELFLTVLQEKWWGAMNRHSVQVRNHVQTKVSEFMSYDDQDTMREYMNMRFILEQCVKSAQEIQKKYLRKHPVTDVFEGLYSVVSAADRKLLRRQALLKRAPGPLRVFVFEGDETRRDEMIAALKESISDREIIVSGGTLFGNPKIGCDEALRSNPDIIVIDTHFMTLLEHVTKRFYDQRKWPHFIIVGKEDLDISNMKAVLSNQDPLFVVAGEFIRSSDMSGLQDLIRQWNHDIDAAEKAKSGPSGKKLLLDGGLAAVVLGALTGNELISLLGFVGMGILVVASVKALLDINKKMYAKDPVVAQSETVAADVKQDFWNSMQDGKVIYIRDYHRDQQEGKEGEKLLHDIQTFIPLHAYDQVFTELNLALNDVHERFRRKQPIRKWLICGGLMNDCMSRTIEAILKSEGTPAGMQSMHRIIIPLYAINKDFWTFLSPNRNYRDNTVIPRELAQYSRDGMLTTEEHEFADSAIDGVDMSEQGPDTYMSIPFLKGDSVSIRMDGDELRTINPQGMRRTILDFYTNEKAMYVGHKMTSVASEQSGRAMQPMVLKSVLLVLGMLGFVMGIDHTLLVEFANAALTISQSVPGDSVSEVILRMVVLMGIACFVVQGIESNHASSYFTITPQTTIDDIKKQYRKLAFTYHPDRNKGTSAAEETMKAINEEYSRLCDRALHGIPLYGERTEQRREDFSWFWEYAQRNGRGASARDDFFDPPRDDRDPYEGQTHFQNFEEARAQFERTLDEHFRLEIVNVMAGLADRATYIRFLFDVILNDESIYVGYGSVVACYERAMFSDDFCEKVLERARYEIPRINSRMKAERVMCLLANIKVYESLELMQQSVHHPIPAIAAYIASAVPMGKYADAFSRRLRHKKPIEGMKASQDRTFKERASQSASSQQTGAAGPTDQQDQDTQQRKGAFDEKHTDNNAQPIISTDPIPDKLFLKEGIPQLRGFEMMLNQLYEACYSYGIIDVSSLGIAEPFHLAAYISEVNVYLDTRYALSNNEYCSFVGVDEMGNIILRKTMWTNASYDNIELMIYALIQKILPRELLKKGVSREAIDHFFRSHYGVSSVERGVLKTQWDDVLYMWQSHFWETRATDAVTKEIDMKWKQTLKNQFDLFITACGGWDAVRRMSVSDLVSRIENTIGYPVCGVTRAQMRSFYDTLGYSYEQRRKSPFMTDEQFIYAMTPRDYEKMKRVHGEDALDCIGLKSTDRILLHQQEMMDIDQNLAKMFLLHEVLENLSADNRLFDYPFIHLSGHANFAVIQLTLDCAAQLNSFNTMYTMMNKGFNFKEKDDFYYDVSTMVKRYFNNNDPRRNPQLNTSFYALWGVPMLLSGLEMQSVFIAMVGLVGTFMSVMYMVRNVYTMSMQPDDVNEVRNFSLGHVELLFPRERVAHTETAEMLLVQANRDLMNDEGQMVKEMTDYDAPFLNVFVTEALGSDKVFHQKYRPVFSAFPEEILSLDSDENVPFEEREIERFVRAFEGPRLFLVTPKEYTVLMNDNWQEIRELLEKEHVYVLAIDTQEYVSMVYFFSVLVAFSQLYKNAPRVRFLDDIFSDHTTPFLTLNIASLKERIPDALRKSAQETLFKQAA